MVANGLTIDAYKETYGLPSDYPTTAPAPRLSGAPLAMRFAGRAVVIGSRPQLRGPCLARIEAAALARPIANL